VSDTPLFKHLYKKNQKKIEKKKKHKNNKKLRKFFIHPLSRRLAFNSLLGFVKKLVVAQIIKTRITCRKKKSR